MKKTHAPHSQPHSPHSQLLHSPVNILSPTGMFTAEKVRGIFTHLVSGGVVSGLNVFGIAGLGWSPERSGFVFAYLIGSVLSYSLDILFAKRDFRMRDGTVAFVPYGQLGRRAAWLMRSYAKKHFFRYVVAALLDTIVGLSLLRALITYMDRKRFLADWKWRDPLAAVAVGVVTFFLFANVLRFDWAYAESDNPVMNMIVLMSTTVVLTTYALSKAPVELKADQRRAQ